MHGSIRYKGGWWRGRDSTQPRDVYTTPKERSHIDFAEMKRRFRLEFRLNADMFPLVGLDLPLLSRSFFLCIWVHANPIHLLFSFLDHAQFPVSYLILSTYK